MQKLKSNWTFSEVYPSFSDFKTQLGEVGEQPISDKYLNVLFINLYSRWAESQFIYDDKFRIHASIYTRIYDYGRAWEEKEKLQEAARGVTLDDAKKGSIKLYNQAQNQANLDTNNTTDSPMDHVDVQNAEVITYSKTDSILTKREVLDEGLVDDFIRVAKFKKLFLTVWPEEFPVFVSEINNEEEEEE